MARLAMELCGKNAGYQVQPRAHVTLDMDAVARRVAAGGARVLADAGVLLVVAVDHVEVSVHQNGKLLLKTDDRAVAERIALALYAVLGIAP